jgi:hypothetical protein
LHHRWLMFRAAFSNSRGAWRFGRRREGWGLAALRGLSFVAALVLACGLGCTGGDGRSDGGNSAIESPLGDLAPGSPAALDGLSTGRFLSLRAPDGAPLAEHPVRESYALDDVSRSLSSRRLACPPVAVRDYPGLSMAFTPAARVIDPLRQRLGELEDIIRAVSINVYARIPSQVLVAASYGCRSVSGENRRLSEHALGNAIDIRGFVFAPAKAPLPRGAQAPLALEARFEVDVQKHWKAKGDAAITRHARFLRELTEQLVARRTFRTALGPAHRDHADHFHFDMAPQPYVDL